ncbi:MAG: AMP-binding protein [Kiritimatiellia bacterium]
MSLFRQFKANRDEHPDAAAFLIAAGDRSVPISWREFARDIEAIGWIIRKYVPGATIALIGANSYEWMTAHAACQFSGAVALPLEVNLSAEDIAERMAFTGARVLIHSAALAERAHAVKKMLPKVIIGSFGSRVTDRMLSLAHKALDAGEPGLFDLPERDEDEVSMLVFTSGTTSKPRGAELTLHGIRTFSDFWERTLYRFGFGQRTLMLLPLNHIFGISVTYTMLAHGVALGVCPDFRRIYEAVERFRAGFLFLVPALADVLAEKIAQKGRTVDEIGLSLRWLLVGGAPLPSRTYLKLKTLGIQPLVGYGLTETTALFSVADIANPRPGSAGICCAGFGGMEARVSPEGILQLRGPAVLKGYYREPEKTAAVLDAEGWFSTGDYGRIDADGNVWITGRASRTIILSSGKKIAPEELEERLLSLPGFLEVVVSGDFETREVQAEVYASVAEETVREQIALLNQKLPLHKRIRRIVVRSQPFPRTASGKIKVGGNPPPKAEPALPVEAPVAETKERGRVAEVMVPVFEKAVAGVRRTLSPERWRWVVLGLGALAGFIVLWHVFGEAVLGQLAPASRVRVVLESINDRMGEVLAVLVLAAAVAVWRTGVFKSEKSRKGE